jgi:mannose-6-phosphate isomerase class I
VPDRSRRKSSQYPLPRIKPEREKGSYDIYPSFSLGEGLISKGFESLAEAISVAGTVVIDGYQGVFYDEFREKLESCLAQIGIKTKWWNTEDYLRPEEVIDKLVAPFLGGDDPLFGKRASLSLDDFFYTEALKIITPGNDADLNIIYGPGAALWEGSGMLLYIDIPKNEIQFRSRAGSISNLGARSAFGGKEMYKRFYFVDWVVLNRHKKELASDIDILIDGQDTEDPSWMKGNVFRNALSVMSRNLFRVRPWFEPGAWGGTWIKEHIRGLNTDVPNYAWSFELIVPENGLLFESSGLLLEASFDFLMFMEAKNVLGEYHPRFGFEFPIRFDFLDTFDGGNLSVQCHPRPDYMKENFGENFTQEETYYILDTKDNADVYLGFQEDIDPGEFRQALELSAGASVPVEIDRFVQKHTASKHDLFLIPYGTIHGSGANNLVLEISSTPNIFTFKMYDWLRMDLDGKPRSLNIARAFDNLYFDRKGAYVREKLISRPELLEEGPGWQLFRLPTHDTHLYDVHRYHFEDEIEVHTNKRFHVLSLVEGSSIEVETRQGLKERFSYAETFVIPAAAGKYTIKNLSRGVAMLVMAFVK